MGEEAGRGRRNSAEGVPGQRTVAQRNYVLGKKELDLCVKVSNEPCTSWSSAKVACIQLCPRITFSELISHTQCNFFFFLSLSSCCLPVSETAFTNPRIPKSVPALCNGEYKTDNPKWLHYLTADASEFAPWCCQGTVPTRAATGSPLSSYKRCVKLFTFAGTC